MNDKTNGSTKDMAKVAFYTIVIVAALMLVSLILDMMGLQAGLVGWLQAVGALILFVISAIVGWQYCRQRNWFVQLIFFISVAAILVSILLPRII
ncbi:MAG: hypothetical protein PHE93_01040 [Clostridia bacterium]|nr:hypothetical protein [Clostridia bacterium]